MNLVMNKAAKPGICLFVFIILGIIWSGTAEAAAAYFASSAYPMSASSAFLARKKALASSQKEALASLTTQEDQAREVATGLSGFFSYAIPLQQKEIIFNVLATI